MKLYTFTTIVLFLLLHIPKTATSQTTDSSSTNIDTTTVKKSNPYLRDFGVWFGVSGGIFASTGGGIDQRLSIVASFEMRSKTPLGFFGELHYFKHNTQTQEGTNLINRQNSTLYNSIGPKLRYSIDNFNACIEVGIGFLFFYPPFCFQYSTSLEYFIDENIVLNLSQKAYANDQLAHFFQIGISCRTTKK